jgi:hypothetical protein
MGANQSAHGRERVQIASDGYRGDREALDKVGDGDLAILIDQIQEVSSALLSENAGSGRHAPFQDARADYGRFR